MSTTISCSHCNDIVGVICDEGRRIHANGLRCGKCHAVKSTSEFYANASRDDGYGGHCKTCEKLYHTGSKPPTAKNKKRAKQKTATARKNTKWLSSNARMKYSRSQLRRFYNYPNQCKRRGIDFHLTLDEYMLLTNTTCHYCGLTSYGKDHVGIDRIDCSKPYVLANCVPCCGDCNYMKGTMTRQEFVEKAIRIAAIHKKP